MNMRGGTQSGLDVVCKPHKKNCLSVNFILYRSGGESVNP